MNEPEALVVLNVNGATVQVNPGTTVAGAVLMADTATRTSVTGERRGPLCGMGICFECRVAIDGIPYERSCQVLSEPGMRVTTP